MPLTKLSLLVKSLDDFSSMFATNELKKTVKNSILNILPKLPSEKAVLNALDNSGASCL